MSNQATSTNATGNNTQGAAAVQADGQQSANNQGTQNPPAQQQQTQGQQQQPASQEASTQQQSQQAAEIKYDLKKPDGSLLEDSHVDGVTAFAKEHGLSNEVAQKLLDRENSAKADQVKAGQEFIESNKTKWLDQVQGDKELGGDNFKENIEHAHRALEKFGSESLRKELESTGFGNHPEVVRAFSKIGRAMADDKLVLPTINQGGDFQSVADKFYPTNKKEE